jgi:hypothetical protein
LKGLIAKLGFVHGLLWRRDATYRIAVLLGPPPLLGGLIAVAVWYAVPSATRSPRTPAVPPPWAAVSRPNVALGTDAPRVVKPARELPSLGPNQLPAGFVMGWQGGIQPVEINGAMDANVLPRQIASLDFDMVTLPLDQITAASPGSGRFVGVGTANLAVRSAGIYELTLQVERHDTGVATCLQRLVFGGQRLVSNLDIDLNGPKTITYAPISFSLTPGLYPIAIAFGCWRGENEAGAGSATVLIRLPGQDRLRPAREDEILRPAAEGTDQ